MHDPSSSVAASKWLMAAGSVHPLMAAHVPSVVHCEKHVLMVNDEVTFSNNRSFQCDGSAQSCPPMYSLQLQSWHAPLVKV